MTTELYHDRLMKQLERERGIRDNEDPQFRVYFRDILRPTKERPEFKHHVRSFLEYYSRCIRKADRATANREIVLNYNCSPIDDWLQFTDRYQEAIEVITFLIFITEFCYEKEILQDEVIVFHEAHNIVYLMIYDNVIAFTTAFMCERTFNIFKRCFNAINEFSGRHMNFKMSLSKAS